MRRDQVGDNPRKVSHCYQMSIKLSPLIKARSRARTMPRDCTVNLPLRLSHTGLRLSKLAVERGPCLEPSLNFTANPGALQVSSLRNFQMWDRFCVYLLIHRAMPHSLACPVPCTVPPSALPFHKPNTRPPHAIMSS